MLHCLNLPKKLSEMDPHEKVKLLTREAEMHMQQMIKEGDDPSKISQEKFMIYALIPCDVDD